MKKKAIIVAIAAVSAASFSAAQAADDFAGLYAGGALSMSSLNAQFHDYNDTFDNQGLNGEVESAASAELFVGWNMQDDNFVYGVELGVASNNASSTSPDPMGGPAGTSVLKLDMSNSLSLKGRVGMANGNTMTYLAGGFVQGKGDFTVDSTWWGGSSQTDSVTLKGITYGVGIEHRFAGNLMMRLEAGATSYETSSRMDHADGSQYAVTATQSDVKLGVAYKF